MTVPPVNSVAVKRRSRRVLPLLRIREAGATTVDEDWASDMTCVVFTVPDKRLAAMDVATGPCVPLVNRKTSVVSVHQQEGFERPDQTAALFDVLGGPAENPLVLIEHRGRGWLYRCSDAFMHAMADANELLVRLAEEDKARGDRELTAFQAKSADLDAAWMQKANWHPQMRSARNRLLRIGKAKVARDKAQSLYIWYGPRVPEYVIIAGSGPYPGKHRRSPT